MTHHTEVFEGGTIDIEDDTSLTINGKEISYVHDAVKTSGLRDICLIPNMIHYWIWRGRSSGTPLNSPV